MSYSPTTNANILIATENTTDCELIQRILIKDFDKVFTSSDPSLATADFERYLPNVLILAFNTLEQSQRYYLGLYRQGGAIHLHSHRTIALSDKDEMQRAYKLCLEGIFDDYNLFWPVSIDVNRLAMSVHLALRELAAAEINTPTTAEFATKARKLATLENTLEEQITKGNSQIDKVGHAVVQASKRAGAALDTFSQRLTQNKMSEAVTVKNADQLQQEIGRLKQEAVEKPLNTFLAESVRPLKQWASELPKVSAPHLESIRSLNALTESVQPTLLVVDDDEFQHKIIGAVLKNENYHLLFASTGLEALNSLRKTRPDLIMMDFMMPGMDGVEVVQQIKAVPNFAEIPILMMTGKSDKAIVMESLKAGATSFIVKPIERSILLDRIQQILSNR